MAWTAPITWIAGTPPTAAQLNQQLRDNFLELEPAKATAISTMFFSTGPNQIVERRSAVDNVIPSESTASTSYAFLATPGPVVTLTTGTAALVCVYCRLSTSVTNAGASYMSWSVSGATTRSASDTTAIKLAGVNAGAYYRTCAMTAVTDLTAGSNTFTARYRAHSGDTATFADRRIIVLPLN